ncbi:MAG: hypothetical protein ABUT20_16535, partial [Bacteroidota bacterium]
MSNKCVKIFSFFVVLLTGQEKLLAQEPYFEEENVLSASSEITQVNGIAADANNCIWLTTQSGVYRYDGNHFRHYSILNTPVLKFERMAGILQMISTPNSNWCLKDGKGNLYEVDSLSQIKPLSSSFKNNSQIISGNFTLRLRDVQHDNIVPLLKNNILDARFSRSSNRLYILLINGDIVSISSDELLSGKKGKVIYNAGSNRGIFTTNKSLYVVTATGILRWDDSLSTPQSILLKGDIVTGSKEIKYDNIKTFQPAGQNCILLSYRGNIYEVNELYQNNTLSTRLLAKGSTEEAPLSVFYSPTHQLLMCYFYNKGLILYHPIQFSLLKYHDPQATSSVQDYYYSLLPSDNGFITVNNSGIVWLGKNGDTRVIKKGKFFRFFLFKDKIGNLWYQPWGEDNYISYLQAGTQQPIPVLKTLHHEVFTGMYQKDDSTYYILTSFSLIKVSLKSDKGITSKFLFEVPDSSQFNMLYGLNPQTLWLGTDRGLLQYNIVQNLITPVNNLANTYVRAVAKLAENN